MSIFQRNIVNRKRNLSESYDINVQKTKRARTQDYEKQSDAIMAALDKGNLFSCILSISRVIICVKRHQTTIKIETTFNISKFDFVFQLLKTQMFYLTEVWITVYQE